METLVSTAQPYEVDVEVQFEFKKPLIATSVGQVSAIPAGLAQLNASKDGVVDQLPGVMTRFLCTKPTEGSQGGVPAKTIRARWGGGEGVESAKGRPCCR